MCRIAAQPIAVPIAAVEETLRPLVVEKLSGVPDYVLGCAIVRGGPMPVISGSRLLGFEGGASQRWLTLKVDDRRVALAVDEVVGLRDFASAARSQLPPLLRDKSDIFSSLATLDAELLLILRHTKLVSDLVWTQFDQAAAGS